MLGWFSCLQTPRSAELDQASLAVALVSFPLASAVDSQAHPFARDGCLTPFSSIIINVDDTSFAGSSDSRMSSSIWHGSWLRNFKSARSSVIRSSFGSMMIRIGEFFNKVIIHHPLAGFHLLKASASFLLLSSIFLQLVYLVFCC